jgi:hypothetical protein
VPAHKFASICPGVPQNPLLAPQYALPPDFVAAVREIEAALNLPVWLLVQDGPGNLVGGDFDMLGYDVAKAFFAARHRDLQRDQRIALVIDSEGGLAKSAYEIATLLRRHCGGFVAVIPRHAKSAATLLTLGADDIYMNDFAELGPLDVQVLDPEREERISGLDEVQSLERLHAFALDLMDKTILLMMDRSRKKARTVLPFAIEFITRLTQPMFQHIDVVRYTQMSRLLKVAQDYGERLLRDRYGNRGGHIAEQLVEKYPIHDWPIYPDEAAEIGLEVAQNTVQISDALEKLTRAIPNVTAIGKMV